jgi:hypothetical protein
MKRAFFEIDENFFEGIYNERERWNGFCCPFFNRATALKIMKIQDDKDFCLRNEMTYYEFCLQDKHIIEYCPEGVFVHEAIDFENEKFYRVGGMCWTWVLLDRLTDEA